MPANWTLVEQAVLGFQLVMNDVEQAPIAIHLSLSPSRTPLFHLHPPVDGEDGTQDVETPAGQRHFVNLHNNNNRANTGAKSKQSGLL